MFLSRVIGVAMLASSLVCCSLSASARPFRVWYSDELAQKADVIVMATVFSNKDERDFSKEGHKPDDLVPVITTFGVDALLKGIVPGTVRSRAGVQIKVEHMRYFDPMSRITIIDGAGLTEFDAKKHPRFLLFLRKVGANLYVPLTGQYDDFQSFVELGNYSGVAQDVVLNSHPQPTKKAIKPATTK